VAEEVRSNFSDVNKLISSTIFFLWKSDNVCNVTEISCLTWRCHLNRYGQGGAPGYKLWTSAMNISMLWSQLLRRLILSDRRLSMTAENREKYLVVHCVSKYAHMLIHSFNCTHNFDTMGSCYFH
jgi:hypothetical protein